MVYYTCMISIPKIFKPFLYIVLVLFLLAPMLYAKDYTRQRNVKHFINHMAKKHRFDRKKLQRLFSHVRYQQTALAIYIPSLRSKIKARPVKRIIHHKPRKRQGSWDVYENTFLKEVKVRKGIRFMHEQRNWLQKAYRRYGVEPEYIAAIIGIESHYGVNRGKFPVFDTLTTLSFERNRRQRFYRKELESFLLLCKKEKVNPKNVKGSCAGAIGLGQFMPSNYREYVVDFDGDGFHRMNTFPDAIGSIAHYLKRHGWQKGVPVATRVSYPGKRYRRHKTGYRHTYHRRSLKGLTPRQPFSYKGRVHLIKLSRAYHDELWYGTKNFYVITRYNHSDYYAMAVHQLAQRLKKAYKMRYGRLIR